jgi:hypothetical protein
LVKVLETTVSKVYAFFFFLIHTAAFPASLLELCFDTKRKATLGPNHERHTDYAVSETAFVWRWRRDKTMSYPCSPRIHLSSSIHI